MAKKVYKLNNSSSIIVDTESIQRIHEEQELWGVGQKFGIKCAIKGAIIKLKKAYGIDRREIIFDPIQNPSHIVFSGKVVGDIVVWQDTSYKIMEIIKPPKKK